MDDTLKAMQEQMMRYKDLAAHYTQLARNYEATISDWMAAKSSKPLPTDPLISVSPKSEGFPVKGSRREQILWVMANIIGHAVRLPDFVSVFQTFKPDEKEAPIKDFVRKLINEGKVRAVKYENHNMKVYYGLIEWVKDGDFHEDYYTGDFSKGAYSTQLIERVMIA